METGSLLILSVIIPFWFLQFVIIIVFGDVTHLFRVASSSPSIGWLLSPLSHGGPSHIIQNSLGILILGSAVEKYIKTRYYLLIFMFFGITSNVMAWWVYTDYLSRSIAPISGASGAIFGFGTFYFIQAWLADDIRLRDLPKESVSSIYFMLSNPVWLSWLLGLAAIILGITTSTANFAGFIGQDGIAHMGHGVGVLLGLLLALLFRNSLFASLVSPSQ